MSQPERERHQRVRGAASKAALGLLLLALALPGSGGSVVGRPLVPSPDATPFWDSCDFLPDRRVNVSFVCGGDNTFQPAYTGGIVRFLLNVSDADGHNMSVTFYFDYLNPNPLGPPNPPVVNPDSPTKTVNVTSPGPGISAPLETNWTYTALSNFSLGLDSSRFWVYYEVRDEFGNFDPGFGADLFYVVVNRNSEPFMDGLSSTYAAAQTIRYQDPRVPLVYINVSVSDPDTDPVTVTWDWGDGARTVNVTGPLVTRADLNVTHQYSASLFPLNETPRTVNFAITVYVDDGVGHNVSYASDASFDTELDNAPGFDAIFNPDLRIRYKVNEVIPFEVRVTDPEGDPIEMYWDFDDRTDSDLDGDPTRDRDAVGTNRTSQRYPAAGDYGALFWYTDGPEKKLCLDANCTVSVSHWKNQSIVPVRVRENLAPIIALSNQSTILGDVVILRAAVSDPDGDSLAVIWDFGDGSPLVTNVTPSYRVSPQTVEVFQAHLYASPGAFSLTLTVDDANATVNDTRSVVVESFNQPPGILPVEVLRTNMTSAGNNTFFENETVIIRLSVYDSENDTLAIVVNWGDGNTTTGEVNLTASATCTTDALGRRVCTVTFSHDYGTIGTERIRNYTVQVSITDNRVYYQVNTTGGPPITRPHTHNQTASVFIRTRRIEGLGPWDVWDFGTMALVLGIPAALLARAAWRIRKEREEE